LTRPPILLTLELTLTLRRFLRKLLLLEQRRATTAKLPLLLGRQPRVLRDKKTFTALTGSGIGSQSSASQLQKEWADTASSAGSGETSKTRARNLTLAELSKQFATVKESLGNAGLQFIEAERTVNVSNFVLASNSFVG
jgi:hypothetical protein